MQISDDSLKYAFDPLKVVDIKTLANIADNFKNSKNKKHKAVGVFLDRINRIRSGEAATGGGSDTPLHPNSGLRDLRE